MYIKQKLHKSIGCMNSVWTHL